MNCGNLNQENGALGPGTGCVGLSSSRKQPHSRTYVVLSHTGLATPLNDIMLAWKGNKDGNENDHKTVFQIHALLCQFSWINYG